MMKMNRSMLLIFIVIIVQFGAMSVGKGVDDEEEKEKRARKFMENALRRASAYRTVRIEAPYTSAFIARWTAENPSAEELGHMTVAEIGQRVERMQRVDSFSVSRVAVDARNKRLDELKRIPGVEIEADNERERQDLIEKQQKELAFEAFTQQLDAIQDTDLLTMTEDQLEDSIRQVKAVPCPAGLVSRCNLYKMMKINRYKMAMHMVY